MGFGMGFLVMVIIAFSFLLSSCNTSGFETAKYSVAIDVPVISKVTRENYMSGEQFCAKYANTGEPLFFEIGKWIDVPYDYTDLKKTIKIYVYTKKAFDAKLPTFIFVDGGPGQNTHTFPDIVDSGINQIHFDQRGVGCSAPTNWDDYTNQALYSSLNTARDIDEIRKAYSLTSISVYGVSYGTVPATIYASKFEKVVKSLVIEGVVGRVENLSRYTYDVEKFNLVVASLNTAQKKAFDDIVFGDDENKQYVVRYFLESARYQDGGFRTVKDVIFKKLFPETGGVDEAVFKRYYGKIMKTEKPYDTAQFPGAVDENVLTRFYCKELGGFSKDKFTLNYTRSGGFSEEAKKGKKTWANECAEQGITLEMENTYDERNYPTSAPVYYFQGSHDGATVAEGALNHWKFVPKDKSYFLLSLKGGHNPAFSKTYSADTAIAKIHQTLFLEALNANPIGFDFIQKLNAPITNSTNENEKKFNYVTWELFTSNKSSFTEIEKEFKGLRSLSQTK